MDNTTDESKNNFRHVYETLMMEELKIMSDQSSSPSLKADIQRRIGAQLYYAVNSGKTGEDPLIGLELYNEYMEKYFKTVDAKNPKGLNSFCKDSTKTASASSSNSRKVSWSLKDLRSNSTFQKFETELKTHNNRLRINVDDFEKALECASSLHHEQPTQVTKIKPCPEVESNTKPAYLKNQQSNQLPHKSPYISERKPVESTKTYPTVNVSVPKLVPSSEKPIVTDETPKTNAFCTAKEKLIIDQKKKNSSANGNHPSTSNGPAAPAGVRQKSLGPRRGLNSPFILPIKDAKQNESDAGNSSNEKKTSSNGEEDKITDERLKNIEPRMIELIENEIMDNGAPVNWDDIAGLEFAKKTIKEIVVWPMLRPDIFTGLRGPPRGILLFGPPGTGKTLIGKCIASQSKSTFFSISASSLTSKWVGEGEKMVRALFAVARVNQPSVIFIDEIDSLLSQRSDSEHESSRRIKTEFLVQLDGATTSQEDRLLVVGATNRPQELDEAARRRLVKRLYIPLPEFEARKQIIQLLMTEQRNILSERQIDDICQRTDGYSCADMTNVCKEAAFGPIRSIDFGDIEHISSDQVRPITIDDFEAALCQVRASVSSQDLALYNDWNSRFGSAAK